MNELSFPLESFQKLKHGFNDLRKALDQIAFVTMTDPKGKILYANKTFETFSGYTKEELVGKNHRIINSGFHSKEFFQDMWNTILDGNVWKGEIRNRRKDGSLYWVETAIVPFRGRNGQLDRILSVRFDITEKKRIEESLKSSQIMWERLYTDILSELDLAQKIQKLIMIPQKFDHGDIHIASRFRPCSNVSGDLIATRNNSDGSLDILFADVAGHGISAALISSSLVFTFQNLSRYYRKDPKRMLDGLYSVINRVLEDLFISAVTVRLIPSKKKIQYCYAGHLPILRERNNEWTILDGRGTPLDKDIKREIFLYESDLEKGDRFFFFSDGVFEVINSKRKILGYDEFVEGVKNIHYKSSDKLIKFILRTTMMYCNHNPKDDISLLVVDFKR